MKKQPFILTLLLLVFFACEKTEGEGGRSSIIGKLYMNDQTGSTQGEYYLPDERVYIIYGEKDSIYDDDVRSNFDGSFEFKNLREGYYTIYAYSEDISEPSGLKPVFVSTTIDKNETVDIGTIMLEK
ncbi:hypothetical protein [Brumimicrobium aurantiacum]|uniref:Carboxypeptidase regulatory-like domain-containing protein n=1 Tax=Brumimicrobium aurantiacum TaxID=1737063 RepID=A0A3E1EV14_9FLAO|nr:hypothetical protein [Brumimicrobium aurantiacum]RFC53395.1 hypothetical protein DXU93_13255 [Brumimicrobium aurantiacum]